MVRKSSMEGGCESRGMVIVGGTLGTSRCDRVAGAFCAAQTGAAPKSAATKITRTWTRFGRQLGPGLGRTHPRHFLGGTRRIQQDTLCERVTKQEIDVIRTTEQR